MAAEEAKTSAMAQRTGDGAPVEAYVGDQAVKVTVDPESTIGSVKAALAAAADATGAEAGTLYVSEYDEMEPRNPPWETAFTDDAAACGKMLDTLRHGCMATLHLRPPLSEEEADAPYTFFVKTLTGKTVTMGKLTAETTVPQVMQMFHEQEGIPMGQFTFVTTTGQRLEPDSERTLVDLGLFSPHSLSVCVHCILRLGAPAASGGEGSADT